MTSAVAPGGLAPPLQGEPLCLDLVNTTFIHGGLRGHPVDALPDPAALDRLLVTWLDRFPADLEPLLRHGGASRADLQTFLTLRAAIRNCLAELTAGRRPRPADTALINRHAAWAGHDELVPGDPVHRRRVRPVGDAWRAAAGEIATDAVRLLGGPDLHLVHACPAPGCILYFLRQHARRRWCTDTCGNRVRVARHGRQGVTPSHEPTRPSPPSSRPHA